jgi:hypothetical protein
MTEIDRGDLWNLFVSNSFYDTAVLLKIMTSSKLFKITANFINC